MGRKGKRPILIRGGRRGKCMFKKLLYSSLPLRLTIFSLFIGGGERAVSRERKRQGQKFYTH